MNEDSRLSLMSGRILSAGLLTSLILFVVGFLWLAINPGNQVGGLTLAEVLQSLLKGEPRALVSLSLITLLITPFAAVLGAVIHFARTRERAWAGVSLGLLAVLVVSMLAGLL